MSIHRKSLLDAVTDWFTGLREGLQNLFALPADDGGAKSDPSVDPDFHGWVANDPMVTLNPASRYGDDATGFLAGSEVENPDLGAKDD